ncbi:hypothetical protein DTO207G8_7899 [Paecilomyces variotii]|nr:hypothetical protein DTO207G8_7899 [Paecilomyces variotii]
MIGKSEGASLSYSEALKIIEAEASKLSSSSTNFEELVPLPLSLNRISSRNYVSPESTPKFDTSAMDGYALNSEVAATASPEEPVRFCVMGTSAAGDSPVEVRGEPDGDIYPCVEIMTGARFPTCVNGREFDCCVKVEDTRMESGGKIIQVLKPARKGMNRRFAGNDFQQGDNIIDAGDCVKINHLMALASIGVEKIAVRRKPRIAVFSTGKELLRNDGAQNDAQRIMDINGPCITASLTDWGCDVDFLGVIDDNASDVSGRIMQQLQLREYDILMTTGGVSAGKFDFVRKAIESIGAKVLFHGAAIRPGHPVLFATLPSGRYDSTGSRDYPLNKQTSTAFFGLPGNPVASAACLRFLVVPLLRQLLSEQPEKPMKATIRDGNLPSKGERTCNIGEASDIITRLPPNTDVFRAGRFTLQQSDKFEVEIIHDHSPGKIKPFLGADCWIHIPRGHTELKDGDALDVYPICKQEHGLAALLRS